MKFIIASLSLGSTQAAAVAKGVVTSAFYTAFPKFETPEAEAALTTATEIASDRFASSYGDNYGPLRGLRSDFLVFLPQAYGPATDATTAGALEKQGATTRSFWQTSAAALGKNGAAVAATTASANSWVSGAAVWSTCTQAGIDAITNDVDEATKCPGGPFQSHFKAGTPDVIKTIKVPDSTRIGLKASSINTGAAYKMTESGKNYAFLGAELSWNKDFLVASMFQGTATKEDDPANTWCSAFMNTVKDGKASFIAYKGFNGKRKCTWQARPSANTKGLLFKVTGTPATIDFNIQWVEVAQESTTSAIVLPKAELDTTGFLGIGSYDNANGEMWYNPVTGGAQVTGATTKIDVLPEERPLDPEGEWQNGIGMAGFYQAQGPFPVTAASKRIIDSGYIVEQLSSYSMAVNTYNSAKSTYDGLKNTYETALDGETARKADFFKSMFEPVIAIPERPCAPTRPAAFTGPNLDLTGLFAATAVPFPTTTNFDTFKNTAYIQDYTTPAEFRHPQTYNQFARGWLRAGTMDGTTVSLYDNHDHAFGKFGQGISASKYPKPFLYGKPAAGFLPSLMVTLIPTAHDLTEVAAGKTVEIAVSEADFQGLDAYKTPDQPAEAAAPKKAAGAQALLGGFVASLAVAASLY